MDGFITQLNNFNIPYDDYFIKHYSVKDYLNFCR